VKAAEHLKLAQTCLSDEVREIHTSMASCFIALADDGWIEVGGAPRKSTRFRMRDRVGG